MTDLANKQCIPCRGGVAPLSGEKIRPLLEQLGGWHAEAGHHLEKQFQFPDFRQALAFVNRVGELAEQQGHHPELTLTWGKCEVRIWTHKIDGLTESDFVLAARIDQL